MSFIIPAYNAERTIERCIRSIVLQKKWAPKIEIIVVDDGSTDRTAEMAKALGRKSSENPIRGFQSPSILVSETLRVTS